MQQLFNKKLWLLAVPLAMFMAGCSGGNDNNGAGSSSGGGAPPDTTAPTVSSTIPTAGATGVAINRNITATFSEAMDAATITTATFTLAAPGPVPVPGAVTYVGTVATFDPIGDLAAGTSYTATVTTGVKDLAGNPLAVTKTWSFTTGTAVAAGPEPVSLGTAGNFVILAKSGISTVPTSVVTGDIGVSPIESTAITGFSLSLAAASPFATSAMITGKVYAPGYADPTPANLTTAIGDMETAYTDAAEIGRASCRERVCLAV